LWIETRPKPQVVTMANYMAKDGAVTKMSWQAAKFLSYTHAKQFAKRTASR